MEKFNHIELNNEVTKRGDNGFFRLEKDQEAIAEFLREVDYKTVKFSSEIKRLRYLVEENYYYNIFDKYIEDEIVECLELAANYLLKTLSLNLRVIWQQVSSIKTMH